MIQIIKMGKREMKLEGIKHRIEPLPPSHIKIEVKINPKIQFIHELNLLLIAHDRAMRDRPYDDEKEFENYYKLHGEFVKNYAPKEMDDT